ncbi:hypothetical protein KY285_015699 [Solanum tuberosum]|nr:hypothetical protein KY285_015699 [Solanum tuberosum]
MENNWIPTRGWRFDPSDNDILNILENYVTGRANPPQSTFNFANFYGDITNPSALFAVAVGDPANPTIKYFVNTVKDKISVSSSSGFYWKRENQLIGIINEVTGENRGFKKSIKLFQKGVDSDELMWIMTEYSLNSNTPGVEEDLKNEVICRVRRILTSNPKVRPNNSKKPKPNNNKRRKMKIADIDLQLKL